AARPLQSGSAGMRQVLRTWPGLFVQVLEHRAELRAPGVGLRRITELLAETAAVVRRHWRGRIDHHLVRNTVRLRGGIEIQPGRPDPTEKPGPLGDVCWSTAAVEHCRFRHRGPAGN